MQSTSMNYQTHKTISQLHKWVSKSICNCHFRFKIYNVMKLDALQKILLQSYSVPNSLFQNSSKFLYLKVKTSVISNMFLQMAYAVPQDLHH